MGICEGGDINSFIQTMPLTTYRSARLDPHSDYPGNIHIRSLRSPPSQLAVGNCMWAKRHLRIDNRLCHLLSVG